MKDESVDRKDKGIEKMIKIPQMLLIGSAGRNSGKTTLAKRYVSSWHEDYPLIGVKVVTIREINGGCQRGIHGCSVCTSLTNEFEIIQEEPDPILLKKKKDTQLLLAAGCQQVFFMKCLKTHLFQALEELMQCLPEKKIIICESNSLRNVVEPGVFLFLNNHPKRMKPSAQAVVHWADFILSDAKATLPEIQVESDCRLSLIDKKTSERSFV